MLNILFALSLSAFLYMNNSCKYISGFELHAEFLVSKMCLLLVGMKMGKDEGMRSLA